MSKRYWIVVIVLACIGALAGGYVARMVTLPAVPSLEGGTSLPQPRVLAPFNLVDTRNAPVSPADLRVHPSLVFFGFTNCPDVCPTTLALLTSVRKQAVLLDPRLAGLKIVLISVDPERDTPEQLGRY